MPARIAQNFAYSSGRSVKCTGVKVSKPRKSSSMRAIRAASSSGVEAFVSVSTAVRPVPVGSFTASSDLRSSISALKTIRSPARSSRRFIATTARHASRMSLK